jgi:hypothetical protein
MKPSSTNKYDNERLVLSQECSTSVTAENIGSIVINIIQKTGGSVLEPKNPPLTTHFVGLNSSKPTIVNWPKDVQTIQIRKKGIIANASI